MPLSLSPAPDMLKTVRSYLEAEILPNLRDAQWFNLRVALNILAMVERELRFGAALDAAALERLTALLGRDGTLPELNRALAEAIRAGAIADDDPELLRHLERSTREALEINNPNWIANP